MGKITSSSSSCIAKRLPGASSWRTIHQWIACIVAFSLAVLSAQAQALVASLSTGPKSCAIAVNSMSNRIYVVHQLDAGTVTVIDGATNAMATIPVGKMPVAVAVDESTNKVYVANSVDGTVSVIDGATNAVVATVATGVNPSQVVINTNNHHVYVVNDSTDGTETVLDGTTYAVLDQIFGGGSPSAAAVDPATDTMFVIATGNNNYPPLLFPGPTVYSAVGLVPNVPLYNGGDTINLIIDKSPYALAFNPATSQLFTANVGGQGIDAVNIVGGLRSTYATFSVGNGIWEAIAVNTKTDIAYAAGNNQPSIAAINGKTLVETPLDGGPYPVAIVVDEYANVIYTANFSDNGTVTAVDGETYQKTTIPAGIEPSLLALNTQTHRLYVLNSDPAGTVNVISAIPPDSAPVITMQPVSQMVNSGSTVALNVASSGRPSATFQWTLNGTPLSDGANVSGSATANLVLTGVVASNAGGYAVIATNSIGSAASAVATLAVTSSPKPGRIINLSTRARIESGVGVDGSQVLIAGFVVKGAGSKSLVLRGIGPSLANFAVPRPVADPSLTLFDSAVPANLVAQDAGWQSPPVTPATGPWSVGSVTDATAADFSNVGAFALAAGSGDSALKLLLPAGAYTAQVSAADSTSGIVLAEVYDSDPGVPPSQLVNVSSRALVGNGIDAMIAGFVIAGSTSQTVLIRASGPALAPLGVGSVLPYPNILLYDAKGSLLNSNTGWGGNPQIAAAAARVGAFPWSDTGSSDAALLVTLPPGTYTAEINPILYPAGNALVEVYAVP